MTSYACFKAGPGLQLVTGALSHCTLMYAYTNQHLQSAVHFNFEQFLCSRLALVPFSLSTPVISLTMFLLCFLDT